MSQSDSFNAVYRSWRRLALASGHIEQMIETGLKSHGLPAHAWYDLLALLAETFEQRSRPNDLEKQLGLAQYTLSRLLDRMEAGKVIERQACAQDGRGQWICLTVEGQELLGQMQPIYAEALQHAFAGKLAPETIRKLGKYAKKILAE